MLKGLLPLDLVEMDGVSIVTNTAVDMCGLGARCSGGQMDSDHESIVSDYSEMADPVKEHLASIHLMQEAELRFGSVLGLPTQQPYAMCPWLAMQRRPDEDEVEFLQRQRKINFLSLAQEFAAIKKVNPSALPFNLHQQRNDENDKEENEKSGVVNLAQELSAVSCVDNSVDEVRQVEASGLYSTADDDKHISQCSHIVTNGCSCDVLCAAEQESASESGLMVSSIPDVVLNLHDGAHCDLSQQPDTNCAEVNLVDDCHFSEVPTGPDDHFKMSSELSSTVMSHSKNMDLVSHTYCCYLLIFVSLTSCVLCYDLYCKFDFK